MSMKRVPFFILFALCQLPCIILGREQSSSRIARRHGSSFLMKLAIVLSRWSRLLSCTSIVHMIRYSSFVTWNSWMQLCHNYRAATAVFFFFSFYIYSLLFVTDFYFLSWTLIVIIVNFERWKCQCIAIFLMYSS